MVELYGRTLSRRDTAARAGMLAQFAGVRLMTLADGPERGVRMLDFRTGSGLRFTVMVDRAMDIGECDFRGMAVGWNSPAGFRHPGLHEYEGEGGLGWLRSFSGLLATCGLDHFGFMHSDDASQYHYAPRKSVDSSLHGRIANIPARLTGYGEVWDGDECTLFCEGEVSQATVFGENLLLVRRIEARVGSSSFTLRDRVVNRGFYRTPHMLCYHINLGYPVIDEGSRYLAPVARSIFAAHASRLRGQDVGYRRCPAPQEPFDEQVWEHSMRADDDGMVPVAVVNDALGIGFMVETRRSELPCHFQWQHFQANAYTMGIEPATNHILGKQFARERGELIELDHGEERSYTTRFHALAGASAIAAAEERIRNIAVQPQDDYPVCDELWDDLRPPA